MDKLTALRLLEEAGYEAYLVGGCVRDMLLDNENILREDDFCFEYIKSAADNASDIDVTTDALPKEVERVFSGMQVIETGIKHGTVTVLMPGNDCGTTVKPYSVEITTYRVETGYSDGRHPDSVKFTSSLHEDLARRDFTINAIAVDINGNVRDPFGGVEDIRRRLIKAVGDPDERFQEDALRIMRALRFAAVLGFDIEKETEAAIFRNRSMLKLVSAERVFSEFRKLVTGKNAGAVVRKYVDVLGEIIPELSAMKGFEQHNAYHKYDVLEHCVRAMEAIRTTDENRIHMKLAALFHDIGKPLTYSPDDNGRGHFYGHAAKSQEVTDRILKRLKVDKTLTERVGILVKYHDLIFQKDEALLKKWMNRFTPEVLFEILEIKIADNFATGNMSDELRLKFNEIEEMMTDILNQGECFSLNALAVNGRDIMSLGVSSGPQVGEILDILLNAVIEGQVVNNRKPLLEMAAKYVDFRRN